jgi:tRNA(fMet)-specific endonuclease VapC
MKRGLLDTDMLSYFLKGRPEVVEKALQYLSLYSTLEFTVITYYEIRRGLEWARADRKVAEFEELANISMIWDLDRVAAAEAARISATLKRQGVVIDEADILIAGIALAHSIPVITHNVRHFSQIPGLEVEDWLSNGAS